MKMVKFEPSLQDSSTADCFTTTSDHDLLSFLYKPSIFSFRDSQHRCSWRAYMLHFALLPEAV